MIEWIIYLAIGVLAGTSAGLFGLGGGLIVVPALAAFYSAQGMNPEIIMHVAVSTSLMTIVITSLSSAYSHARHGHINWRLLFILLPGVLIGSLLGAYFAVSVSTVFLQYAFVIYMLLAAVKVWLPNRFGQSDILATKPMLIGFGMIAGSVSALIGSGGGSLTVPYLVAAKQSIKHAIGTSAACGFPIAVAAVIGFLLFGEHLAGEQSGLIDWKAFGGIIITSIVFARVGANLAKRLPVFILQRIFSVLLLLVAAKMWLEIA